MIAMERSFPAATGGAGLGAPAGGILADLFMPREDPAGSATRPGACVLPLLCCRADHDFRISRDDLLRYGNHSLTYRIVDRIFAQVQQQRFLPSVFYSAAARPLCARPLLKLRERSSDGGVVDYPTVVCTCCELHVALLPRSA